MKKRLNSKKRIKRIVAIPSIMLMISTLMLFAGCNGGTGNTGNTSEGKSDVKGITENGLTYYTLLDYSKIGDLPFGRSNLVSVEEDLKDRGIAEDYICVVEDDAPKDLVIPDEFNGGSVVILTSNPETAGDLRFDSIQFGKNLIYIYRFAMFGECENVTELSFPAKVKSIQEAFHNCKSLSRLEFGEEFYYADVSFYKCESLKEFEIPAGAGNLESSFQGLTDAKITFNKVPYRLMDCFAYSENLVVVLKDTEGMDEMNFSYPYDSVREIPYDFVIGTEEVLAYSDLADEDAILQKGTGHFCETLDADKKIDPADAKKYAEIYDGPIVTVETCPEIKPSEYTKLGRDALLKSTEAVYESVADNAWSNSRSGYPTGMKEAPTVYFIAEKMGGIAVEYTGNVGDKTYYQMVYRISVRDIETDELLCWFEAETGDVPGKIESTTPLYKEGDRTYFQEGVSTDVTPWYVVKKYFE